MPVSKVGLGRATVLVVAMMSLLTTGCSGGGDDGGSDVTAGASGDAEDGPVVDDGRRRQIASGADGPPAVGEVVATSAEQWQEKWAATGATTAAPDVSEVDFDKEVAVGLFAGEKPSGGWRIDPDVNVRIQGRFAAIDYAVVGPGEGCMSSQALTSPYLVLAVKAGAARFVKSERTEPCE